VAKKKTPDAAEQLTFESALGELERVVAQLEGGKLGLAESLAVYERGVARLTACYHMLEAAERKIELVQSVDADGKVKTTPLDDAEDVDLSAKSASRSRRRSAGSVPAEGASVDDTPGLF
jgi:exodeoxyribonuclease VII small subunit